MEVFVLWAAEYTQKWVNKLHSHDFFQLMCCVSGSGDIKIDNNEFEIEKQHIYLIPPSCEHRIKFLENDENARVLDVKFSVHDDLLTRELLNLGTDITVQNFSQFYMTFKSLLTESNAKPRFYKLIVNVKMTELLVNLIRDNTKEKTVSDEFPTTVLSDNKKNIKGINAEKLLEFINTNFSKIMSLDEICDYVNINKTTLIEIFKDVLGTTPMKYVNLLKHQKAKELLCSSDISISEIACIVGFQSIHYFSKAFKKKENLSPIEFRARQRTDKYYSYEELN